MYQEPISVPEYNSREVALLAAMGMVEEEAIVEHGVIDLDAEPPGDDEFYWLSEDEEMSKADDFELYGKPDEEVWEDEE